MPKLIRNWEELFALPSNDKYTIVPEPNGIKCGWIEPIVETPETEGIDYFKHRAYLSTHIFDAHCYRNATKLLQRFGFDVELDNLDKKRRKK